MRGINCKALRIKALYKCSLSNAEMQPVLKWREKCKFIY
uniref:Uncharacterized protein n=1 Tax=Anguilla anguilla TaxID=7936 RepID=A0A0E9XZA8_ANGAN